MQDFHKINHFNFQPTPVDRLDYFSDKYKVNLWVKRDDLFAPAGGGSKARLLQYIVCDLVQNRYNTMVSAGGPCSNFNRAAALFCAQHNIKLKLVVYTEDDTEFDASLNFYLTCLCGAEIIYCKKSEVSDTIQKVLDDCKKNQLNFKFIYGGGRCLEGFYAYYDAVKELRRQFQGRLDHVFVACATGTTTTGICVGMQEYFPEALVHGISVARTHAAEMPVISENLKVLNLSMKKNFSSANLDLRDDFVTGGYGKYNDASVHAMKEAAARQGLLLDPTYSGKAFWGMTRMLEDHLDAFAGSNVLFWHTGGIFNLLSAKKF